MERNPALPDLDKLPDLNQLLEQLNSLAGRCSNSDSSSDNETGSGKGADPVCTTIEAVQDLLREQKVKNVIVCTGAGVSTSAGIPDFRTPGTGLYSNLEKYNLPRPEAVFDINYFKSNPNAFYTLSKDLLPGLYAPTVAHHFIKLLQDEGILLRVYSQNIDGLEGLAGIVPDKLVEAHGSFASSHCVRCRLEVENDVVFPGKGSIIPFTYNRIQM